MKWTNPKSGGSLWILLCFVASLFLFTTRLYAQNPRANCPTPKQNPPQVSISSQLPVDVCIPDGFPGNPIDFFDDFSWRSFIALVWPVTDGQRGTPDDSKSLNAQGARVFETYKATWEVFHADGSAPAAWNQYDSNNPCGVKLNFGDFVAASFSKFGDLGQAGQGKLLGPLAAQNGTYVRYETGIDENEFSQIVGGKLYIRSNLPKTPGTLKFQNGSIDVKSAWVVMDNVPHPERYYTRQAWIINPATGNCSQETVGLVGLHIVQKTPSRPQWIWSTFEQVDNVPLASSSAGKFTFNDGTGTPMPGANPLTLAPLDPNPKAFNVQRLLQISPSTLQTNSKYQQALKLQNSVWQFYQLVMTQWPLQPNSPGVAGTPNNTFPGLGATSPFSNVVLETFEQNNVRTGCMNCHNSATTDFLWTLNDHAFPASDMKLKNIPFKSLQELLRSAEKQNTSLPPGTDK